MRKVVIDVQAPHGPYTGKETCPQSYNVRDNDGSSEPSGKRQSHKPRSFVFFCGFASFWQACSACMKFGIVVIAMAAGAVIRSQGLVHTRRHTWDGFFTEVSY